MPPKDTHAILSIRSSSCSIKLFAELDVILQAWCMAGSCSQCKLPDFIGSTCQDYPTCGVCFDVLPRLFPRIFITTEIFARAEAKNNVETAPKIHTCSMNIRMINNSFTEQPNVWGGIKRISSYQASIIKKQSGLAATSTKVGNMPITWQHIPQKRTKQSLAYFPFIKSVSSYHCNR